MIEREIKILDIDVKKTIKKLEKLGAKKHFEGFLTDHYYSFLNKKIRLRILEDGKVIVCLKTKIKEGDNIKTAIENEIIVNKVQAQQIVFARGLKHQRSKFKKRITYKLENTTFDIDIYPGINPLIEIESENIENIYFWKKKLFGNKKVKTFGAKKLHEYYNISLPKIELFDKIKA